MAHTARYPIADGGVSSETGSIHNIRSKAPLLNILNNNSIDHNNRYETYPF